MGVSSQLKKPDVIFLDRKLKTLNERQYAKTMNDNKYCITVFLLKRDEKHERERQRRLL